LIVAEQVEKLPSKIVQYNNTDDVALCEDGSVWYYDARPDCKKWTQVHPPHEPPTHAADLAEALEVLRSLWSETEPDSAEGAKAYGAAARVLQKHGVPTK
jgi:hypothetical protein